MFGEEDASVVPGQSRGWVNRIAVPCSHEPLDVAGVAGVAEDD